MGINILPEDVFNKISAGEVVERPASIVKELVENSIDAGATKISIEIFDGGLREIIITDNGSGIEPDDIEKAFMPHATSKIQKSEDLENIASLGFRGEALASITAVSQVEMITKTENHDFGVQISYSGGKFQEKSEIGAANGTKIVVKNLFFNTPARLKFMKKPKSEEGEVTHLLSRLILANPSVSFRYSADGKIIYNTFGNGLAEALYIVYGKDVYDNLIEINSESGDMSIRGYIARPTLAKPNRTYGTLFVNGRLVNNYMIFSAITDALEGFIMKGKFPLFALNLNLPFEDVDVNVHPSKQEVKFANPGKIYGFVSNAIYKAVSNVNFIQNITNEEKDVQPVEEVKEENLSTLSKNEGSSFSYIMNIINKSSTEDKFANQPSKLVEIAIEENEKIKPEEPVSQQNFATSLPVNEQTKVEEVFNHFEIIGVIFNTYIILQKGEFVYFIDQHAAHERQLYDKIMASVEQNEVTTQSLFMPIEIGINEKESSFLTENQEKFKNFGFNFTIFDNVLKIVAIPYIISNMNIKDFFDSVFAEIDSFANKPLSYINERFTQLACKSAVKAGNVLSKQEISILLDRFAQNGHVLLCPHGRPIVLQLSRNEIEKMFKRKL